MTAMVAATGVLVWVAIIVLIVVAVVLVTNRR